VTDPPDDRFVCALVDTMATLEYGSRRNHRDWYRGGNAWFVLKRIPVEQLLACIDTCAQSDNPETRRGAVEALCRLQTPEALKRLGDMTADPDHHVSPVAVTRLNAVLRENLAERLDAESQVIWKGKLGAAIQAVIPASDESHVFVALVETGGRPEVWRFDTAKRKAVWRFKCDSAIASNLVSSGDRLFFCTRKGSVHSLDTATGKELWEKVLEDCGEGLHYSDSRIAVVDAGVMAADRRNLWVFNVQTGALVWKQDIVDYDSGIAVGKNHIFARISEVVEYEGAIFREVQTELAAMNFDGEIKAKTRFEDYIYEFCASGDRVYTVTGRDPAKITAFSAKDLSVAWRAEVQSEIEVPLLVTPEVVIACSRECIIAFNPRDGRRIWSSYDGEGLFYGARMPQVGSRFLMRVCVPPWNLEFRDIRTGVVKHVYPKTKEWGRPFCAVGGMIACSNDEGWLLLLKAPGNE